MYIEHNNGHYDVMSDDGKFLCSGDTYREALEEMEEMENGQN